MERRIGIDIGGSKIIIALFKGKKTIKKWVTLRPSLEKLKGGLALFPNLKTGVAFPGILDQERKRILKSPNTPSFEGINLSQKLKRNILIENDAKCFLLAEKRFGALRSKKNGLGIIFGTGIGGAFMENEKIYLGFNGSAGEFGQMILGNGQKWEQIYQERKEQKVINSYGIANLANILDPQIIILAGQGGKVFSKKIINNFIVSPLTKKTQIISSKLGENVVALGASLLFDNP